MHPLMQAFRDAQPDGAGDLALVAPGREPAPARTGVTRRDVLAAGVVPVVGQEHASGDALQVRRPAAHLRRRRAQLL